MPEESRTGQVLLKEFLKSIGISQNHPALKISVPTGGINEIVPGRCRISADTPRWLAQYFGTTAKFRLGLQTNYALDMATFNIFSPLVGEI